MAPSGQIELDLSLTNDEHTDQSNQRAEPAAVVGWGAISLMMIMMMRLVWFGLVWLGQVAGGEQFTGRLDPNHN